MTCLGYLPVFLATLRIFPKRFYHPIQVFITELGEVVTRVGLLDFLE